MVHHNTKSGNKMFGGLEDIIICCDLDPFFSFHKTLWLLMMYHQNKFGCQGINSSDNVVERVIF